MPIPKPKDGEPEKDFISRCVSQISNEYEQEQALAICYNQMSKAVKLKKQEEVFVLTPKKAENRGKYLSRCSSNNKMKAQFPNMKERMGQCLNAFNAYYKYWSKLEDFSEKDTKGTNLGACIAREKAKGFDYKEAYNHCASKVVVQPTGGTNPQVLSEEDEMNMDVLGYMTKYFYICPGAVETFKHLISMNPKPETARMIRNAAVVADSIFEIEDEVLEDESATEDQLQEAKLLVKDFYDLMSVIDGELGMKHDVKYMDGHIEKIKSYLTESMEDDLLVEPVEFADLEDACWEGYEPIGLKDRGDGRMVPNCVPIKMTEDDFAESITDYPEGVKDAAKRALAYVEKNGWGSCGTAVGKQRANQLAKGEPISVDTVKRMFSFLSRHKGQDADKGKYGEGCGKLMYDAWGGNAALTWAERKLKQLEQK
jgi:hypothetical protein